VLSLKDRQSASAFNSLIARGQHPEPLVAKSTAFTMSKSYCRVRAG